MGGQLLALSALLGPAQGERKTTAMSEMQESVLGSTKGSRLKKRIERHYMCHTSEYKSWGAAINRCECPNAADYHRYGGRGIKMCTQWRHSFAAFLADMGKKPSPRHSLDRYPNKDGNYEPGNCRWASPQEQAQNTVTNHFLEFNGKRQTVADWSRETGIKYVTLLARIQRYKWTIKSALTIPPLTKKGPRVEVQRAI